MNLGLTLVLGAHTLKNTNHSPPSLTQTNGQHRPHSTYIFAAAMASLLDLGLFLLQIHGFLCNSGWSMESDEDVGIHKGLLQAAEKGDVTAQSLLAQDFFYGVHGVSLTHQQTVFLTHDLVIPHIDLVCLFVLVVVRESNNKHSIRLIQLNQSISHPHTTSSYMFFSSTSMSHHLGEEGPPHRTAVGQDRKSVV